MCAFLSSLSHKSGFCFATNEELAAGLGTTDNAIKKMLSRLDETNLISIHNKKTKKAGNRHIRLVFAERIEASEEIEEAPEIPRDEIADAFDRFYEIYPRKQDKGPALKMFKTKKLHKRIDDLIRATKNFASTAHETEKQFIKLPATFLNNSIWEEYLSTEEEVKKISNGAEAQVDPLESFRIKSVNVSHALFHSGKMNKIDELEMQWNAGAGREGFTEREAMVISAIGFARFIKSINDGEFVEREMIPAWERAV